MTQPGPHPQQPQQGIPHGQPRQAPQQPHRSVREYLSAEDRPVDAGAYVVLPITLMEQMPPLWQDRMTTLLEQLHQQVRGAPWPARYKVEATEWRPVAECDERQLAAVGIEADYDPDDLDGDELIYRDKDGEISDPYTRRILVPIPDPLMS